MSSPLRKEKDMKIHKTVIIIPARYGSSRLPGKPLVSIGSRPMILHVYDRANQVPGVAQVAVATDDVRILECVENAGGIAFMTDPSHPSGTDRIAEVARKLELNPEDIVINVQGDQPLLELDTLTPLFKILDDDRSVHMATVACPLDPEDARNPNRVKVVIDREGRALYFSRARIPYDRDGTWERRGCYLRHLGLYAYRNRFLQTFVSLEPGTLEQVERLEQLRALENGFAIKVVQVERAPIEVDTKEDLDMVRALIV